MAWWNFVSQLSQAHISVIDLRMGGSAQIGKAKVLRGPRESKQSARLYFQGFCELTGYDRETILGQQRHC